MSVQAILDVLRRRWKVATAGLLLVLVAVGLVVRAVPSTYSYTSSVLLLPPEISRVTDPTMPDYTKSNPLFYLGTLGQARDILIASLTSKDMADQMDAAYPDVTYKVAPDVLSTGPIVVIVTESPSRKDASAALDMLTGDVDDHLAKIQSELDIEQDAMVGAHLLTRDKRPEQSFKAPIRAGILVGGALSMMLLFGLAVLDPFLVRRRARKDDESGAGQETRPAKERRPRRGGAQRGSDADEAELVPAGEKRKK